MPDSRGAVIDRSYEDALPAVSRQDQYGGSEQRFLIGSRIRNRAILAIVVIVTLSSILSYFVKPRQPLLELCTPDQEIPNYAAQYPGDNSLADRVKGSFGLAMVLVQSPYLEKNVSALESLRQWAKDGFQEARDFLHPVSIPPLKEPNDTVLGAIGYNLFAGVRYYCQSRIGDFLAYRIAEFHKEPAYISFQTAFFDLFGKDSESATLLARYQSDKAKTAIDVVLWTIIWSIWLTVAAGLVTLSSRRLFFERLRWCLSGTWALIGISYSTTAWMSNSIPAMLSGSAAFLVSLYLLRPFLLLTREDASLKVKFIQSSSTWIALATWLTYTAVAGLILTWIRGSIPQSPDPITLLLSSLSGNFLQDPEDGKRLAARLVGILWVICSLWAFTHREQDARVTDELEDSLNRL